MKFPIDAVITWVDGNDTELRMIRNSYKSENSVSDSDEISGESRYATFGELWINIASLNRMAPWLRRIFIVTDGQHPDVEDWISSQFANPIPISIVDHKEIFSGYEELLPTFNSLSIETMLWRIPDLSEHYIYLNDDCFLTSYNTPENRFTKEGSPVVYGRRMNKLLPKLLFYAKKKKDGVREPGYKNGMVNAADLLESSYFTYYQHSVVSQRKSIFEEFYDGRPELLRQNASYRFRDNHQFSPHALNLLLCDKKGSIEYRPESRTMFLKPVAGKNGYITRKIRQAERNNALQGCCNSLNKGDELQRREFMKWIERRLQIKLPQSFISHNKH